MGTLAYLAPERLGGARASAASDVWSLGALACVGLTGRPPRMGGSIAELVEQRDDAPPSVLCPEGARSRSPGSRSAPRAWEAVTLVGALKGHDRQTPVGRDRAPSGHKAVAAPG